jgi:hypothetical protein
VRAKPPTQEHRRRLLKKITSTISYKSTTTDPLRVPTIPADSHPT